MTTNTDDLDDFFKKKDRKGSKHKKQTGLLTNNQELLKQLEFVTIATSTFKENLDFDEEDDDHVPFEDGSVMGTGFNDNIRKNPTKVNKAKPSDHIKYPNEPEAKAQHEQSQQDEWEDFGYSTSKYEELRSKIQSGPNEDDEYFDDENNLDANEDDSSGKRQQAKDKTAWKLDQLNKEKEADAPVVQAPAAPAPPPPPQPASSSAYRPPHARGVGSVTALGGSAPRVSKKKEPNLASVDEFPSLQPAVMKK